MMSCEKQVKTRTKGNASLSTRKLSYALP